MRLRSVCWLEDLKKRIFVLSQKLDIKEDLEKEKEEDKYNLLTIPDDKLTPEQLKQKRIQKMHKTAALLRAEKKEAQKKEQVKKNRGGEKIESSKIYSKLVYKAKRVARQTRRNKEEENGIHKQK